jgi:hypothetical protein
MAFLNSRECLNLRARRARARSAHSSHISLFQSTFVLFAFQPCAYLSSRFVIFSFSTFIPKENNEAHSRHECTNIRLLCSQAAILYIADANMSLASSPDFQVGPEDRAFDSRFHAEDPLTETFDDYLAERYDLNGDDNKATLDNFLDFFEKEATASGHGYLSSLGGSTRLEASPAEPWRKGLWCLEQKVASLPEHVVQNNGRRSQDVHAEACDGRAGASHNTGGNIFTNFSRPVPRPHARTPSHEETKSLLSTSPRTARGVRHIPQPFSREGTLSPNSSYVRNQHNNKMAYQESLQHYLQNFHLLANGELGPPLTQSCGRLSPPEHPDQVIPAKVAKHGAIVQNQTLETPPPDVSDPYAFTKYRHVAIDPGLESVLYSENSNTMMIPHGQALYPAEYLRESQTEADTGPSAHSLTSLVGSEYHSGSQSRHECLTEMQQLWSPLRASATEPDAPCSYQEQQYPTIAAPIPHRPTYQLLQEPLSPKIDGLGIHYVGAESSKANDAYTALFPLESVYSYPPLPEVATESIHTSTDLSPFTTPRHRRPTALSPSRSTSPSISPTNTKYHSAATSRSLRQSSPTRQAATRRKSIGAAKASSFTHSHHPSTSSARMPRGPRTPKTPTGPGPAGAIDFVNFTPKDSAKLLSDVAPSGSSKTRARREQEARDKRRRLSEAAVRAVRRAAQAAGADVGDGEVEALERAILA